jgi:hypothetical protein
VPFITGKLELDFYNDSADTEFPEVNVPSVIREFKSTTAAEVQTTVISLAASGSQTINLNGLDAVTGLYLYSASADLLVNINGLGNLTLKYGRPAYIPVSVTSLVLTNSSASLATTVECSLIKE